ncbi:MAG: bifunctional tetrahydrofolate synthase/dihydrofolate synthase [Dokdonella sp.]
MRTLDEWLDYQKRIHPREIELGLDRIRAVWERLGSPAPALTVISVGGTNGKGSTVAFLEAMTRAAGLRVGAFTSPHLLAYNERIRIDGVDSNDASLVAAFERIERARGEIALTYFEFNLLAAVLLFADAGLDLAILEVGLGGRLDAVNLIDADASIVTTIDLDHQDWLGNDRDSIGREKAGIFRDGRPGVIGESNPPRGLLVEAERIGVRMLRRDADYTIERRSDHWIWRNDSIELELPLPTLTASAQIDNAASAIAALHALRGRLGWNPRALATGISDASLPGRLQRSVSESGIELLIDVAHNLQAAQQLAQYLLDNPPRGRSIAVFGALADKDVPAIVAVLDGAFDHWHLGGLDRANARGLDATALHERVASVPSRDVTTHPDISAALAAAQASARSGDLIVAFGSFHVAAAAMQMAARDQYVACASVAATSVRL